MEFLATPTTTDIIKPPVSDIKSLTEYKFPTVKDFSFDNLERWVNETDMFVVCQFDTGYFQVANLLGAEQYMLGVFDYKEEIKLFTSRLIDLQLELIREAVKKGADCIWLANHHRRYRFVFVTRSSLGFGLSICKNLLTKDINLISLLFCMHAEIKMEAMDMIIDLGVMVDLSNLQQKTIL
ncbi:MAG: hypothetical protein U5N58_08455 [Actinomycetota bacterium]|nr:hypothetical protein [Actinomycetota bacterium]